MLFLLPAWRHLRSSWVGTGSDTDLFIWSLRWTPYALTHGLNPLYTTYLNHPAGVNLAWSPTMPLAGVALWPVTATLGPIAAYNVLVTLGLAGSSWCAYLALTRWVRSHLAAFLAALAYGFSAYMTAQVLSHGNLVLAFAPPLVLLLLDDILVRQRRSPLLSGLMLGGVLAGQFFLFVELAAGTVIVGGIGVILLLLTRFRQLSRRRLGHAVRALAVAALVLGIATAPAVAWQFLGPHHLVGAVHGPDFYVTDLLNPITPTRALWLAPHRAIAVSDRFLGNVTEWDGYLGVPLILLVIATAVVRWRRSGLVQVMALTGVAAFVLSLGPHLHIGGRATAVPLPWDLLGRLPGLDSLLPARLAVFTALCAAVLLGVGLDALATVALRARWRMACTGAAAVLVLLPLVPRLPVITSSAPVPAAFSATTSDIPAGSAALVFPLPAACEFQPFQPGHPCSASDPMVWQAVGGMRFRITGGYFVGPPAPAIPPSVTATALAAVARGDDPAVTSALRASVLRDLHSWRIDVVIIGPGATHPAGLAGFWGSVLDRSPTDTGGIELWKVPRP